MLDDLAGNASFERLIGLAEDLSGLELRRLAAEGPGDALADTRVAQPLLYLSGIARAEAVESSGLTPVAVAGHSLGELAALAFAGVYSDETGLELVVARSKLMSEAAAETPGTMAAVLGLAPDDVARVVEGIPDVWVANDNAPGQLVISGTRDGVVSATASLLSIGARKVVPLPVSGPFHSPLMRSASESFAKILEDTEMSNARYPVVQNAEPDAVTQADAIRERLARQIASPVRWTETMRTLVDMGTSTLVEMGPGSVLCGLARRIDGLDAVTAREFLDAQTPGGAG